MNLAERKFRRRTLGGVAAAFSLAALAQQERGVIRAGLDTPNATVFPLYENHDRGIDVRDVPSNLRYFFAELTSRTGVISDDPVETLLELDGQGVRIFPDQLLQKLAREFVEIVLGDVIVPEVTVYGKMASALVIGGLSASTIMSARRGFLTGVSYGALLWAGGYPLSKIGNGIYSERGSISQSAIKRLIGRFHGLQSHIHPEDPTIYYRNAAMANKILMVTERSEERTGRKPRLAFKAGYGHGGMEDMLRLSRSSLREILLRQPKPWLQQTVELNGGAREFSSALNVIITSRDYDGDPKKLKAVGYPVTDQELLRELRQRDIW